MDRSLLPGPELAERFAADLDMLVGRETRLGVAVSGGPDSLALLLLASAARPGRVAAATVDHALRPESAGEARQVEAICKRIDVPCATLRLDWAEPPASNIQERAREARYSELARWARREGIGALATGHHADDQAETLLMRLARGSGVAGLRGIQRSRPLDGEVLLVRPLLGWRRAELEALVAEAGLTAADDPSNRDRRFDRTAARRLLAATDWLDPFRLGLAASHCGDAEDALDWTAEREFAGRHRRDHEALLLDVAGLPPELRRRLLLKAIDALGAAAPPGPKLGRAMAILEAGGTTTLVGLKLSGDQPWRLQAAPPRRARHGARPFHCH